LPADFFIFAGHCGVHPQDRKHPFRKRLQENFRQFRILQTGGDLEQSRIAGLLKRGTGRSFHKILNWPSVNARPFANTVPSTA
jgi:hypothetical protein